MVKHAHRNRVRFPDTEISFFRIFPLNGWRNGLCCLFVRALIQRYLLSDTRRATRNTFKSFASLFVRLVLYQTNYQPEDKILKIVNS